MSVTPRFRSSHAELVSAIKSSHVRLRGAIEDLTDAQVAAPSRLPGWSRGHVLAHLAGIGAAAARQVEFARAGELVDLYDGGRPARDASIDAGATAPAVDHVRALRRSTAPMDLLLASLAPADWELPVRFRDGVVLTMVQAWWREAEIHLTDLDLGHRSDTWSLAFCDHATDFLGARAPAGTLLVLAAPEGWVREVGGGAARTVRGARTDLVAWLAGRVPEGPVRADDATGLPLLGPWP